jgi:iron(III) transport system permease protein
VGLLARYAVIAERGLAVSLSAQSVRLEEAAAAAGAGYGRRLLRIVAPLQMRALLGVWLLCFIFGLRDLDTVALFYPAGTAPLTVRLFTLEANGPQAAVAALAVVQVATTAAALGLSLVLLGRRPSPAAEP